LIGCGVPVKKLQPTPGQILQRIATELEFERLGAAAQPHAPRQPASHAVVEYAADHAVGDLPEHARTVPPRPPDHERRN
jgi:hypothetical protein